MNKSLLKLLGIVALVFTTQAYAAGIGGITVTSALGQPLSADIDLLAVAPSEKSSLVARLASPDEYKNAGLDYPFNNKIKLTIENKVSGTPFIHAVSEQPINDPFVSLLVELSWSSGKLVREFTFLLDPVGYQPVKPAPVPVQTVAPVVNEPLNTPVAAMPPPVSSSAAPPIVESQSVAQAPAATEPQPIQQQPVRKHSIASSPAKHVAANPVKTGDVTVKSGDTLNKIAQENTPDGISLERMLVALYRANVNQFDGKNMNRIQAGRILRLPDQQELSEVTQTQAKEEIHAQVADWNAYRQRLASAAPESHREQSSQQVSEGKISSNVAEKSPVSNQTAKEVLRLSRGVVASDKQSGSGKLTNQEKVNAAQEDVIAKAKAAAEEQKRAAMLEKNNQDMKHLLELKAQAAALAQSAVAGSEVIAASKVQAVSAVHPQAHPKPVPKPAPASVVEESFMDQLMANPLYLEGGAAAVVLLGGLALVMRRRKGQSAEDKPSQEVAKAADEHHVEDQTPELPEDEVPTLQSGNNQTSTISSVEEDPITEADLFLSFGRDEQAEEILKEALKTSQNKTAIKMKLLEIYVARKDAKSFGDIATELKPVVGDKDWQQVVKMGLKLDPQNALYGGKTQVEESDSATMQTLALTGGEPTTLTRNTDFDVLSAEPEGGVAQSQEASPITQNPVMDFDITGTNPLTSAATSVIPQQEEIKQVEAPEKSTALPGLEDLVFDVTPAVTSAAEWASEPSPVAKHDEGLPFNLDFDTNSPVQEPVAKPQDLNLSDINLNFDDAVIQPIAASKGNVSPNLADVGIQPSVAAEPAVKDMQWHEVATKLDLARAYQEMSDAEGAREILEEVLKEGDAEQRAAAEEILKQLG